MLPIAPITPYAGQQLCWVRHSSEKRAYELRAAEQVLATLRWRRGPLAEAETADGQWTFQRVGFWRRVVTVRAAASDADLAEFHPSWTGTGRLELGARQLRWVATSFWRAEWSWQDAAGTPLIRYLRGTRRPPVAGRVEITPTAGGLPDLALLVTLGWYLVLLNAQDQSASASAGAIAAVIASSTVAG
jgi:hypothetical protein